MLHKLAYILLSWLLWLVAFAAGKAGFMLYNRAENPFGATDVLDVLRHGLSMDMTTAGYLVALPCLCIIIDEAFGRSSHCRSSWSLQAPAVCGWHRWVLCPYLVVVSLLVALIIVGDACLYPFWGFKLNAIIFNYLDDAQGVTNSVSGGFIALRVVWIVIVSVVLLVMHAAAYRVTLGAACGNVSSRTISRRCCNVLVLLLVAALDFLAIRGGIGTGVQNVGTAYYSQNVFLNHSAVNPAFSLMSSFKRADDFGRQFRFFDEKECEEIVAGLGLPQSGAAPGEKVISGERPNVLIVLMEGFGGKFVAALGGLPEVAPNFNRLVDEGVFFDNYFSNSFRTDRGTVSLLSGHVSYPTTSLMRLPEKIARVPGLARSLAAAGYSTHFLYGGDITFAGTQGYLVSAGYDDIVSDKDFSAKDVLSGKWGVCDSITAARTQTMIIDRLSKESARRPWLLTYQTLSSHEPYEVDYHRLDDPRLNAFAYTDACIGRLVEGLKASSVWSNLLVILVPDHGIGYEMTYENPEFFHCPMLWLGGAVKSPRRVEALMNQSDVCATLLAQLGLPHDEYVWSRDVFSPDYSTPFVYCTYPGGIMYRDATGTTVYDLDSNRPIKEIPSPDAERVRKAKALLQHSYSQLDTLR